MGTRAWHVGCEIAGSIELRGSPMTDLRLARAIAVIAFLWMARDAAAAGLETLLRLRDGSVLAGEVVVSIPGDRVTLRLATGELQTIRWSELASPPEGAAAPIENRIRVHLDTDDGRASLYRLSGTWLGYGFVLRGGVLWPRDNLVRECGAPCDTSVDATATYRIVGAGVTPSAPFTLSAGAPEARLRVHAGSATMRFAGFVITLLGAPFVALGGSFAIIGGTMSQPSARAAETASGFQTAGYAMLGAGLGALAIGIPLLIASRTTVDIAPAMNVGAIHISQQGITF